MSDLERQADELGRTWKAIARAATRFGRWVRDGLARGLSSFGPRFTAGFDLMVSAARQLRARPGLALVVVALVTASWLSSVTANGFMTARNAALAGWRAPSAQPSRLSFPQRWAEAYQGAPLHALLWRPLVRIELPLSLPSSVASRWIGLGLQPVLLPRPATPVRTPPSRVTLRPAPSPPRAPRRDEQREMLWRWRLAGLAILVPAALVSTLLLVPLLGWVRDNETPIRLGHMPGYWRRHYFPMLALALIGVGFALLAMEFQLLRQHFLLSGAHSETLDAALTALNNFAFQVLPALLGLLLVLAPFVIVARGVGAWQGIVHGLRLLRRHWPAMIAVFIVFRVGWEVLVVWDALSPWETSWAILWAGLSSPPTMLLWSWVGTAALALLGLWVAHAFMQIAKQPVAAASP